MEPQLKARIEDLLNSHRVILFMKGTKLFPQCGFSAQLVEVLKRSNAKYHTVNILTEPELRVGMKEYANWPTFPQLYIDAKLIGGCDIVTQMYEEGELEPILNAAPPSAE